MRILRQIHIVVCLATLAACQSAPVVRGHESDSGEIIDAAVADASGDWDAGEPIDAGPDGGEPVDAGVLPSMEWTQLPTGTSPLARNAPAMTFDSNRGVAVLFGGTTEPNIRSATSGFLRDTWEWNGATWKQRVPATLPPARALHAMAYDSKRGVTVLFGGEAAQILGDTWEWDGSDWTQHMPVTSPRARYGQAMAYDSARGVTVLFGGCYFEFCSSRLGDTWEWDGVTWTQRTPAKSPSARAFHTMAYDSARGVTVLFGGTRGGSETWEWDGTTWTQRMPTTTPPPNYWHAMVYDAARGVTVMAAGDAGMPEVWEWDGTDWTARQPVHPLDVRWSPAMVYDSVRGNTVLFGGSPPSNDLSTWDGIDWTTASPAGGATPPLPRWGHALTYDESRMTPMLFGGCPADTCGPTDPLDDQWKWDGTAWRPLPRPRPAALGPRWGQATTSGAGEMFAFGGVAGMPSNTAMNDTWSWHSWAQDWGLLTPAASPPERAEAALAYDTNRRIAVLFGGRGLNSAALDDTWELSISAPPTFVWTKIQGAIHPAARSRHAATFDATRGRTVLFGGTDANGNSLGDTWTWDGTAWFSPSVTVSPPPRSGHAMAWDSTDGEVVLFGGEACSPTGCVALSDTWKWDGTHWSLVVVEKEPPPRSDHAMIYDTARGVLLMFGGRDALHQPLGDTWKLLPLP